MSSIDLRNVELFPEPEFSQAYHRVFAGIQTYSEKFDNVLLAEAARAAPSAPARAATAALRIGAYEGDTLVGWTHGWFEQGGVFYMASSGVEERYRRQGVYSQLVRAMCERADALGAVAVRSQHSVLNNAVIIAKLKLGFKVSGLSHSAHMGALVELTHYLSAPRGALMKDRLVPYARREPL